AQTAPFLSSPYYGEKAINCFFDHEYPNYGQDNSIVIYTGERRSNANRDICTLHYSCYAGHPAYDYDLEYEPVLAAASGTVEKAEWNSWAYRTGPNSGLGLYIRLGHGNGYQTYYGHLSALLVQEGQAVVKGQMIGVSGNTGNSSGAHLHFEVRHNGTRTDPYGWSGGYTDPWQAASGEASIFLWSDGQWAGYPLAAPTPYGSAVVVDDNPNNTGSFKKGRSWGSPVECPPGSCPYWWRVTGIGYGSDMYYTYVNGYTADYWAKWQPSLSQAGLYEVQVYIACNHATTWFAQYHIYSNGSPYDTYARVDQLGLCNQWISLGYYYFSGGSNHYVRTSDATTESYSTGRKVGVDAVRFRRVNVGPFEVEDYRERIGRTYQGLYMNWEFRNWSGKPGWRGSGAMQALPKNPHKNINTGYTTASPELRYRTVFPASGTYYVWVRAYGENGKEDSVHAGYDGYGPSSADRISGCGWNSPGWKWCNSTMDGPRATIYVGAGLHTFNLWMRENGFRADQVLLTQDPSYTPP
ncbi:MAG TPA: hypothetical protein ENF52_02605, partial [Chloroflexi bacterium]|nr:hypothetical protein [Chloroflexota bacterium]